MGDVTGKAGYPHANMSTGLQGRTANTRYVNLKSLSDSGTRGEERRGKACLTSAEFYRQMTTYMCTQRLASDHPPSELHKRPPRAGQ